MTSLGVTQDLEVNQSEPPETSQDFAECGDGVCQPVLRGVCPQDCQENHSENRGENSVNQSSSQEDSNLNVPIAMLVGLLILLTSGLTVLAYYFKKGKQSEVSESSQRDRELERRLRSMLRSGYSYREAKKKLMAEGVDPDRIEKSRQFV